MTRWWLRLAKFAPPFWRGLSSIGLLMLLSAALNTLKPWPIKLLVDNVFAAQPLPEYLEWLHGLPGNGSSTALIAWLAASTLVIFALDWAAQTAQAYVQSGVALRITYAVGARVFEQLQRLSLRYHSRSPTGDLVRRVTTDSRCARDLLVDVLLPAQTSIITLLTVTTVMVQLNLRLTIVTLLVAPAIGVAHKFFYRSMQVRASDQYQREAAMLSQAEQALTALPMIQVFRREATEGSQFRHTSDQTLRAYYRGLAAELKYRVSVNGATTIGRAAVMIVGGAQVLDGDLTVGALLVFLAYVGMLYEPMTTLANLSSSVAAAEAGAQRVFEVLDAADVVPDLVTHRVAISGRIRGEILFENVSFAYDSSHPVLRGINLQIRAGETVALVGSSGAGKTTLVSLLMRFFDPVEGRILLDGRDLRTFPLEQLREQIAIMLQEPFLLPVSVAENIAHGRPTAPRQEIEEAAIAARADEFIRRLPEGYDTVIGERGSSLSGGEKQRLAIARALLKDAPVLILDEPSSALDPLTEESVLEGITHLTAQRTTLVIAHRLSTIQRADKIIVLDRQQVVESGTHQQLLANQRDYSHLFRLSEARLNDAVGQSSSLN